MSSRPRSTSRSSAAITSFRHWRRCFADVRSHLLPRPTTAPPPKLKPISKPCVLNSSERSRICWNCGTVESEVVMRDNMIISELTQAVHELHVAFAHLFPQIIFLVIVAFVGWVVAYLLKIVLRSLLRLIKFDKLSDSAGASTLLTKAALPPATELLSRFVFWVAWLGFILLGVSVLGLFGLQDQIAKFFLFRSEE